MPSTWVPPTSGLTRVTSAYAMLSMNATSIAPPMNAPPMLMIAVGRPLANVVTSPVCGSTREILPAAPSVTYRAPSGPTVLPLALSKPVSRPVTSSVAVGPGHGHRPLAADGVIIVIRAAANSTIPIPTDFVTRTGFRPSARMFCLFMIQFPFLVLAFFDSSLSFLVFEEVIFGHSHLYCPKSCARLRRKLGNRERHGCHRWISSLASDTDTLQLDARFDAPDPATAGRPTFCIRIIRAISDLPRRLVTFES